MIYIDSRMSVSIEHLTRNVLAPLQYTMKAFSLKAIGRKCSSLSNETIVQIWGEMQRQKQQQSQQQQQLRA